MAQPQVTYTFVNDQANGCTADKMNTNNEDLFNALSDGTKDINISSMAAAGPVNLAGSTTEIRGSMQLHGEYAGNRVIHCIDHMEANCPTMKTGVLPVSGSVTGYGFNIRGAASSATVALALQVGSTAVGTFYVTATAGASACTYGTFTRGAKPVSAGVQIAAALTWSGDTTAYTSFIFEVAYDP